LRIGLRFHFPFTVIMYVVLALMVSSTVSAQQKPQWMPGQVGLNAGILPSPGFTYLNITENYAADTFNGPNGNAVPVTGTYKVWVVENLFYYVFDKKVFGGNYGMAIMFPTPATGSLVAEWRHIRPGRRDFAGDLVAKVFGARRWRATELHPTGHQSLAVLEVRARIPVGLPHVGTHDRLRWQLDPPHSETSSYSLREHVFEIVDASTASFHVLHGHPLENVTNSCERPRLAVRVRATR
jgi:hypothetical protein